MELVNLKLDEMSPETLNQLIRKFNPEPLFVFLDQHSIFDVNVIATLMALGRIAAEDELKRRQMLSDMMNASEPAVCEPDDEYDTVAVLDMNL